MRKIRWHDYSCSYFVASSLLPLQIAWVIREESFDDESPLALSLNNSSDGATREMKKDTSCSTTQNWYQTVSSFSLKQHDDHEERSFKCLKKVSPKLLPKLYNKDIKECIVVCSSAVVQELEKRKTFLYKSPFRYIFTGSTVVENHRKQSHSTLRAKRATLFEYV